MMTPATTTAATTVATAAATAEAAHPDRAHRQQQQQHIDISTKKLKEQIHDSTATGRHHDKPGRHAQAAPRENLSSVMCWSFGRVVHRMFAGAQYAIHWTSTVVLAGIKLPDLRHTARAQFSAVANRHAIPLLTTMLHCGGFDHLFGLLIVITLVLPIPAQPEHRRHSHARAGADTNGTTGAR